MIVGLACRDGITRAQSSAAAAARRRRLGTSVPPPHSSATDWVTPPLSSAPPLPLTSAPHFSSRDVGLEGGDGLASSQLAVVMSPSRSAGAVCCGAARGRHVVIIGGVCVGPAAAAAVGAAGEEVFVRRRVRITGAPRTPRRHRRRRRRHRARGRRGARFSFLVAASASAPPQSYSSKGACEDGAARRGGIDDLRVGAADHAVAQRRRGSRCVAEHGRHRTPPQEVRARAGARGGRECLPTAPFSSGVSSRDASPPPSPSRASSWAPSSAAAAASEPNDGRLSSARQPTGAL